jgi:peptide/nickel transport system substrate-binding protein
VKGTGMAEAPLAESGYDGKVEAMRDAFVRASSPEEQKKIAADIQQEVYDQVILYPLGEFLGEAADCGW